MRKKDLTGQRFGRLLVLGESDARSNGSVMWLCQCDCGAPPKAVRGSHLRDSRTQSCGCLSREITSVVRTTHGMTHTPEYKSWACIKERCCNPDNKSWAQYGGRGISMCQRWLDSFDAFYSDMGPRPTLRHSVDRVDVNGNYEPSNCRWATAREQSNNRRTNRVLEIDGVVRTIAEWSRVSGIEPGTIAHRVRSGSESREAVWGKLDSPLKLKIGDEERTISEWSARSGISVSTIRWRLAQGLTPQEAVLSPLNKTGHTRRSA